MNVRLLRKIAKVIQEKPRQLFDMDNGNNEINCDTPHCICGWAAALSGNPNSKEALDLDWAEFRRLYYPSDWPRRFYRAKTWSGITPRMAAARIEHFIKTEGRE